MPETQTIPERGSHVRLGVDPREVRPMGEETTYRLNAEHVIPVD